MFPSVELEQVAQSGSGRPSDRPGELLPLFVSTKKSKVPIYQLAHGRKNGHYVRMPSQIKVSESETLRLLLSVRKFTTQKDVAAHLGINSKTVRRWEKREIVPNSL